jgi:hypothetical protein
MRKAHHLDEVLPLFLHDRWAADHAAQYCLIEHDPQAWGSVTEEPLLPSSTESYTFA